MGINTVLFGPDRNGSGKALPFSGCMFDESGEILSRPCSPLRLLRPLMAAVPSLRRTSDPRAAPRSRYRRAP